VDLSACQGREHNEDYCQAQWIRIFESLDPSSKIEKTIAQRTGLPLECLPLTGSLHSAESAMEQRQK
jgi:hypothetical protein